jgi:hypothetical protein
MNNLRHRSCRVRSWPGEIRATFIKLPIVQNGRDVTRSLDFVLPCKTCAAELTFEQVGKAMAAAEVVWFDGYIRQSFKGHQQHLL